VPAKSGGPEAIKCLKDDEGVALQLTKLRACNDEDLFLRLSLKISIADVSGPKIKVISLAKKIRSQMPCSEMAPE